MSLMIGLIVTYLMLCQYVIRVTQSHNAFYSCLPCDAINARNMLWTCVCVWHKPSSFWQKKPSAYPTLRERKLGYLQRSGHVLSTVACMLITFIQCNINSNNIQSACTWYWTKFAAMRNRYWPNCQRLILCNGR